MEELRRVLREQDAEDKRKGKKSKGKGKKVDGESLSLEEKAEKDRVSPRIFIRPGFAHLPEACSQEAEGQG